MLCPIFSLYGNSFGANLSFLLLLKMKTLESQRFSDFIKGYKNGTLAKNGLIVVLFLCIYSYHKSLNPQKRVLASIWKLIHFWVYFMDFRHTNVFDKVMKTRFIKCRGVFRTLPNTNDWAFLGQKKLLFWQKLFIIYILQGSKYSSDAYCSWIQCLKYQ